MRTTVSSWFAGGAMSLAFKLLLIASSALAASAAQASPIRLQAENFSAMSGVVAGSGRIQHCDPGDWVRYDGVNFNASSYTTLTTCYAVDAPYAGKQVEFRLDGLTGPLIASFTTASTGGWYSFTERSVTLNQAVTGIRSLYVLFKGTGGGVGNFDYFDLGGTTYHVATNGNDVSGGGSATMPWRTARYAAANAVPQSTIRLGAGTFIETGVIELPPSVSLEGAGAGATILKSNIPAPLVRLSSNAETNGNQRVRNLTIDGDARKLHRGVEIFGRNHIEISGIEFRNIEQTALHIHAVDVPNSDTPPSFYLKGIKVHDCTTRETSKIFPGASGGAIQGGHLDGAEFYNITMNETAGYGLKLSWAGGWLKNTVMRDMVINTTGSDSTWGDQAAIELWHIFNDNEVYNITSSSWFSFCKGNKGTGTRSLWCHDFTITTANPNSINTALELYELSDVEISRGTVKGAYMPITVGSYTIPTSNQFIHNNVFFGRNGDVGAILNTQGNNLSNVRIANNTFHSIQNLGVRFRGDYGGTISNVEIKNNIFHGMEYPVRFDPGSKVNAVTITHNRYHQVGTFGYVNQSGFVTNVTSTNNSQGDPGLTLSGSQPSPYFRPLSAGSAVVNAGTNVGLPFNGSAPDIGAYEY